MTDTCVSMYQAPHNESAWSYVRGVMGSYSPADFPKLIENLEEYCQREAPPAQCLELMADVAVQSGTAEGNLRACSIFERLATEIDVVRSRYWKSRKEVECVLLAAL